MLEFFFKYMLCHNFFVYIYLYLYRYRYVYTHTQHEILQVRIIHIKQYCCISWSSAKYRKKTFKMLKQLCGINYINECIT